MTDRSIPLANLCAAFERRIDYCETKATEEHAEGNQTAAHRHDAAARALRQFADELLGPLWYAEAAKKRWEE